jgi:hypothetical protein
MERWVENLVNASIDIGKIVVAAEMLPLPHTYRETMETLAAVQRAADSAVDLYGGLADATERWLENTESAG